MLTLPSHSPSLRLTLRPYQQSALDAIAAAALRGVRRQVIALPTGSGKTIIFAHLVAQEPGRSLILVHRDELVSQTLDKLQMIAPGLPVGVVKAERDEHDAQVVIASVQTLARPRRLERLARDFALVVCDEAHHAMPANTYGGIFAYLSNVDDPPLLLGFTATPFRPNNTPLVTTEAVPGCFDEVAYALPLGWMIEHGFLAPIRTEGIFLDLDMKKIAVQHGDYSAHDLGEALLKADAPEHLVRGYQEITPGRRAMVFCPTVEMSQIVGQAFTDAGIASAVVVGETPNEERRRIYREVRAGDVRVLVNCMVLTEGFDEPSIDAIFIARPTRSKVLYTQAIGRGLRLWPGKEDCIVVDAVGATKRHDLMSVAALLGLLKAKEPLHGFMDDEEEEEIGDDDGPVAAQRKAYERHKIDLWNRTPLRWVTTHRGRMVLSLGQWGWLRIREMGDGRACLEARRSAERSYQMVADEMTIEYCLGIAGHTVRDAGMVGLVRKDATWRENTRSVKAEAFARKLKIDIDARWTAGELSDAINQIVGDWY